MADPAIKQRAYMSFGGGRQSTALAFLAIERHPLLMEACGGVCGI